MSRGAAQQLASYAVGLRYNQIPSEVIARAKACLLDTLTVSLYGSTKPWSQSVVNHVRSFGIAGPSTVIGFGWEEPAITGGAR